MSNNMTVSVKVHPTIREFIINTNGSDTIYPHKDDWMWLLLKQHLDTSPTDFNPQQDDELCTIKIMLLDTHRSWMVHHKKKGNFRNKLDPNMVRIDTLFRWYLSEASQESISRHLRTQFKEYFHNFVYASLVANPRLEQKQAIHLFCDEHEITFNNISEDMLIKSWQRSRQRKKFKEDEKFCPLNY